MYCCNSTNIYLITATKFHSFIRRPFAGMEVRLERARKRAREAEAELVELARPVLQIIAEKCAKQGVFVSSPTSWSTEIEQLGARAREVSDFCNGALSEPVGGFYLRTGVEVCGKDGRFNTIRLHMQPNSEITSAVIPAAVIPAAAEMWPGILADARTRADAALVEMREAARDLVDVLFVSAMPEDAATFKVVFNLWEHNPNPHVEAFVQRIGRTAYWPVCLEYKNALFAQILDAFQRDVQDSPWSVEWTKDRGNFMITATKRDSGR